MKKEAGLFVFFSTLFFIILTVPTMAAQQKIAICHYEPTNPTNFYTLFVASQSIKAHLNHGDNLGECPSIPPVCSTVLCENFNSYSDGPIINQGWVNRANGSPYVIQGSVVEEGTKALYNNNTGADSVITKTSGNALADGRQSFYVRTENRSNWGNYNVGENVQVKLSKGSWDGPYRIVVAFMKNGNVAYNDTITGWTNFDSYADNAWNLLDIEWRSSDKTARYRVNNGTWTDWATYPGASSFTNVDTVGFVTFNLGTGGVYIDYLH